MSSTRRATPGKPLRQERYASSEEFQRGLNGYLVARRCTALERAEDRELIHFLQLLSHRDGGLEKLASDLRAMFPDRIGTKSMHRFGMKPGQVYSAKQVDAIRREMPWEKRGAYPLFGDSKIDPGGLGWDESPPVDDRPNEYPASEFLKDCQYASAELVDDLQKLCLDPSSDMGLWYFPKPAELLREHMERFISSSRQRTVVTALGHKLNEALDYAEQARCMVLIEGLARMGKTFSAKAWAEQHPGSSRYVQVPSTNDDGAFFRAIAKSLGLPTGFSWKAVQLRERVEETLQGGDLLLILDEAHYCWPTSNSRFAFPSRITWIMTALVNQGVPVALISTPQFIRTQKVMEARTHWTSEQFTGRIGHYEKLPDSLAGDDLERVARAILPEGDSRSIEMLVCYAQGSAKYLAGIEAIVRRARYLAAKDIREKVCLADLKRATEESVIPSDSALAVALATPLKQGRKVISTPMQTPLKPAADPLNGPRRATTFADRKPTETPDQNRLAPDRSGLEPVTA